MKNKTVVLLLVAVFCSLMLVHLKKTTQGEAKVESQKIDVKKEGAQKKRAKKPQPSQKSQAKTKQEPWQEQYVLTVDKTPYKELATASLSEDILPQGTVVSVKPVKDSPEHVEIISDPFKGYIEHEHLRPRSEYIKEREEKRQDKLTPSEFKKLMDTELNDFVANKGGDISIYLKTLDDKFSYSFYGDEIKRTASSIKLPFITYVLQLATDGEIDLQTSLTYTEGFKIDGTGIIQFDPIGSVYTLERLAELTIRYSDNVAYLMLLDYVGEANFIRYLHEIDNQSPNDRVFSSPRILSKAMENVIKNKETSPLINHVYTWMNQTIFDDGVAVGLPGVDVTHKTGWMPMYQVSNDIAYIDDKEQPYIVTIMTNGYADDYSEKAIADLARLIDDHVLQLKR